ncbi:MULTISPECIES: hypothetical protein [unclassified Nonomuraea]|uniref:hypothetical protein n=1 Tax=unclassified Nonomuraea TaxID=2593643 RepID=UPI0033D7618D
MAVTERQLGEPIGVGHVRGDLVDSAGAAAATDLCLHLVRLDYGAAVANAAARLAIVPPARPGGQAQFIETPLPADRGTSLAPTRAWALEHLDHPLTLADLDSLRKHLTGRVGLTPTAYRAGFTRVRGQAGLSGRSR